MSFTKMDGVGVKICGLKDSAGLHASIEAGSDWVGFVFFERSPRYIMAADAYHLWEHAKKKFSASGLPQRVGLFVKPTLLQIQDILRVCDMDILQLYGVSEEEATYIRSATGKPVWISKGVREKTDLPARSLSDGLVIESVQQVHETRPGGNGRAVEWSLLVDWHAPVPWLLAGGLTAENVAEAIKQSGAPAVDVSSGVEKAPGVKDVQRITAFIKAAKSVYQHDV